MAAERRNRLRPHTGQGGSSSQRPCQTLPSSAHMPQQIKLRHNHHQIPISDPEASKSRAAEPTAPAKGSQAPQARSIQSCHHHLPPQTSSVLGLHLNHPATCKHGGKAWKDAHRPTAVNQEGEWAEGAAGRGRQRTFHGLLNAPRTPLRPGIEKVSAKVHPTPALTAPWDGWEEHHSKLARSKHSS